MLKIILRILYIPVSVFSASILLQITEVINTQDSRSIQGFFRIFWDLHLSFNSRLQLWRCILQRN